MGAHAVESRWYRWAGAAGIVAFVIPNLYFLTEECLNHSFWDSPFCRSSDGAHTGAVLMIATVLALAALAGPAWRRFAKNFVGALLAYTVLTLGKCTYVWADPAVSAWRATAPTRWRHARNMVVKKRRAAWIAALNARPANMERGIQLASRLYYCASPPGRALPENSAALARRCSEVNSTRGDADSTNAEALYTIPQPRHTDAFTDTHEEVRGDDGWRWAYAASAGGAGYVIRIVRDPLLSSRGPVITVDNRATISIIPASGTPLVVSPEPELHQLAECLQRIPEVERKLNEKVHWAWSISGMASRACPDMADRLGHVIDESSQLLLTVQRTIAGQPAPENAGTWHLTIRDRHTPEGYRFAIDVRPVVGLGKWALDEDGTVRAVPQ
jgi:hypothetical protein